MPSSKTKDYSVEKIVSKRTDSNGRIFYLIKWKGYSSTDNSWEPENHVTNCQDMIKAFEAEEIKKNLSSNASQHNTNQRSTRSSLSPSKKSTNKNERSTRSSNRNSSTRQNHKRASSNDSIYIDNDDDDNGYIGKKLIKSLSSKRFRKYTTDTDSTPSIDSRDSDILDTTKLDNIFDVRRNKKTNTIEYHIQLKKIKKPVWVKSDRLTEDYSQQVIDFLEEKYV